MPAILRIFVYQTDASLAVIGSAGSYGQLGHRAQDRADVGSATICPDDGSIGISCTASSQ